jgi:hypothetical protein
VVGVDYKEYLLRGNETVYMSFIDWIGAMAKKKGRQKSHQTIRVTRSDSANTTPYMNKHERKHLEKESSWRMVLRAL